MKSRMLRIVPSLCRWALVGTAALSLAGCTLMSVLAEKNKEKGIVTVDVGLAIQKDLSGYRKLGLKVKTSVEDADDEVRQYVSQLRSALEKSGAFTKTCELLDGSDDAVDLILDLEIDEIRRVTSDDRTWKGAGAGIAAFGVTAVVIEPHSDTPIGGAAILGSTRGTSIYSGTTEDAIRAAVEGTRRFLLES